MGMRLVAPGRWGDERDELLRVLEQDPAPDVIAMRPQERSAQSRAPTQLQFDSDHDPHDRFQGHTLTEIVAGVVDVYVIRPLPEGWKILVLQRANDTRCPSAWETVHGRLDKDERPEDGARRELREETGLELTRLYNITVIPFYLHSFGSVQLAICFAAFVAEPAEVRLGSEHQKFEWLSVDEAADRFVWPRERESVDHIKRLLSTGDAGAVEDVLRVF
jgi:dATP pyrophosphohydrolase